MAQANSSGSGAGLKGRSICPHLSSRPWKAARARARRAGEQGPGRRQRLSELCDHQRGSEVKCHGSHAFGKHFASALSRDTRPSWWREGPEKSRKEKTAPRAVELRLSYFVCTRPLVTRQIPAPGLWAGAQEATWLTALTVLLQSACHYPSLRRGPGPLTTLHVWPHGPRSATARLSVSPSLHLSLSLSPPSAPASQQTQETHSCLGPRGV